MVLVFHYHHLLNGFPKLTVSVQFIMSHGSSLTWWQTFQGIPLYWNREKHVWCCVTAPDHGDWLNQHSRVRNPLRFLKDSDNAINLTTSLRICINIEEVQINRICIWNSGSKCNLGTPSFTNKIYNTSQERSDIPHIFEGNIFF